MHPLDIIFWTCLMLGGAYTLVTLLMGGFTHAAGHAGDIGHALHLPGISGHAHAGHIGGHADTGHAGHVDAAHGHAGHGHAGHGDSADHTIGRQHLEIHAHGDDGGFNLLQYLNPMSVAGFLLGFGGVGLASRTLGAHPLAALLYGAAGGWGLWLVAYLIITRMFGAAGGTSHIRREELVGAWAHVTAPIAGAQPGMISYTIAGTRQSIRAITDEGEAIPTGTRVRIRKIDNNTAHVLRMD